MTNAEGGFVCPVCGFDGLKAAPRRPGPSRAGEPLGLNEQCPSCGYEFDVLETIISYAAYRKEWIKEGCIWSSPSIAPPANWDPIAQLIRVP